MLPVILTKYRMRTGLTLMPVTWTISHTDFSYIRQVTKTGMEQYVIEYTEKFRGTKYAIFGEDAKTFLKLWDMYYHEFKNPDWSV